MVSLLMACLVLSLLHFINGGFILPTGLEVILLLYLKVLEAVDGM